MSYSSIIYVFVYIVNLVDIMFRTILWSYQELSPPPQPQTCSKNATGAKIQVKYVSCLFAFQNVENNNKNLNNT